MTNGNANAVDEKAVDPRAESRSVIDVPGPPQGNSVPTAARNDAILWAIGSVADEFIPWGSNVKGRDRQLRAFLATEPMFASSLGIIASRNAAFSWTMEGPERSVRKYHRILEEADWGRGWQSLVKKISMDFYGQDNGAFIEVVRVADSERAEIIGINHLDSARCYHTGSPEAPVVYLDRKGIYHIMKWYQVIPLSDMPTAVEGLYGLQYSALTRLLRWAQIIKNISTYDYERTGGRHARAIVLLKGITAQAVTDALNTQSAVLNARGQTRFSLPLMVSSVSPEADVGHDLIELASLPDNFNREEAYKWYVALIAMAFEEDYQTFAPLPGGGLGTSAQSQILHAKSRGKGPALFQDAIMHAFNFFVLPDNIELKFDEQDLDEEAEQALVRKTRAEERQIRILSTEITPEAARNLALDDGDLPQEIFDKLGGIDSTPDVTVTDDSNPDAQLGEPGEPAAPAPAPGAAPTTSSPPAAQPRPNANFGLLEKDVEEYFKINRAGGQFAPGGGRIPGEIQVGRNGRATTDQFFEEKTSKAWGGVVPGLKMSQAKGLVDKEKSLVTSKKTASFDPKKLTATESSVDHNWVKTGAGKNNKPITVFSKGGKDYILDGHHRAAAASLSGKKISAYHIKFEDL